MESNEQPKQPAYTDRRGRMVLAIWENEAPHGIRFSSEITRTWQDKDGKYHTTSRLDERDLLPTAKLAQVADDWIAKQRRGEELPWSGTENTAK